MSQEKIPSYWGNFKTLTSQQHLDVSQVALTLPHYHRKGTKKVIRVVKWNTKQLVYGWKSFTSVSPRASSFFLISGLPLLLPQLLHYLHLHHVQDLHHRQPYEERKRKNWIIFCVGIERSCVLPRHEPSLIPRHYQISQTPTHKKKKKERQSEWTYINKNQRSAMPWRVNHEV